MFLDCAYFYLQQTNKLESDVQITDLVQVEGNDHGGARMGVASALQPDMASEHAWRQRIDNIL